jgi:hypothetical protein
MENLKKKGKALVILSLKNKKNHSGLPISSENNQLR